MKKSAFLFCALLCLALAAVPSTAQENVPPPDSPAFPDAATAAESAVPADPGPAPAARPADSAPAPHSSPHRTAEFGFDIEAGYANGLLALDDIFNVRRALTFNFAKTTVDDLAFFAALDAEAFITVNVRGMSFSLFAGVEASGQAKAENLLLFLREGNSRHRDFSGTARMGGAAFLETGIRAGFPVKKFRVSISPAVFMPLFYMPAPDISYRTRMDAATGEISINASINADIYTAVPLENGGLSSSSFDDFSPPLGADLSAEVVWLFLPNLDLGAALGRIPIVPATLKYRTHFRTSPPYSWEIDNVFGAISGSSGSFDLPSAPELEYAHSESSFTVLRPLRLDIFAVYRPVPGISLFVLRPSLGLAFLTAYGYDQVCFNFTLEGQVNIRRGFSMSLSTGLDEWVWQHRLALMFNLHAVELRLAASLRGTDFAGSWTGKGLGLAFGMSFGW